MRARAGYVRERRAGRAYLLSKRKNGSGEHAGNRSGECEGGARESKRNDWRGRHMESWRGNG